MTIGKVKEFLDEEGWGVLTSADVPGDVWMHFSHLDVPGYRAVQVGQTVEFDWDSFPPGQDGYYYRATRPLRS